ncbi:MAG: DNA polymerase III subunit beta [Gammaproteobacteria bacterium RIFCSPHIGHO2_12_FULL_45_9]|nr:MAG: DNA polymerase III subunit beta [Gammaproteobacteria bacterium RIFCSPHIGHO2_12_FULL_45_9]
MKVTLPRTLLLGLLQRVVGVVERKQVIPILSNVLLEWAPGCVRVRATDLELELVGHAILEGEVVPGSVTVSGRKLLDICRVLPEDARLDMTLDAQQKWVVRGGRSRFTVPTLPVAEFPLVEAEVPLWSFTMTEGDLRALLSRTRFAIAETDVRNFLNGLLLEVGPTGVQAVATDSHRLALNRAVVETGVAAATVVIPRKTVLELERLLSDVDALITLSVSATHIHVEAENWVLTSRLLDIRFPDYTRAIPKRTGIPVLIERDMLRQALQRAFVVSDPKLPIVSMELAPGVLRLVAGQEAERVEDELTVEYAGPVLTASYNATYWQDVLNVVQPGVLQLIFADETGSLVLEERVNPWGSIFVVMPVRL